MVLAVVVGWALRRFAGLDAALLLGLLVGLVAAQLVPARAACAPPGDVGPEGR
ncbi:MAG: hypothetical protein KF830_11035 [Planctomycetes bacterium]|nr:hypothetical protein [Planctomycetota bacterium]